jgi:hypothetical protein
MTQEVLIGAGESEPVRRRLDAPVTAGGSRADAIQIGGLPPAALALEPVPTGVVVVARVPGLRVDGRPVAPGTRRLLRPGDRAALQAIELAVAPLTHAEGTRAAAAALLRDAAMGLADAALCGPSLLVLDGPDAGLPLPLEGEQVIGRSRSARPRLVDPSASRRHARLRLVPGGATIEDLGAKNRVRVNGVRIDLGPVPLRSGDVLTIGKTTLALQLPEVTGAASGAPARTPAASRPPRRRPPALRVPVAREPVAPLLGALLLAVAAVTLLAAACGG